MYNQMEKESITKEIKAALFELQDRYFDENQMDFRPEGVTLYSKNKSTDL